jgi:hypothetical protein
MKSLGESQGNKKPKKKVCGDLAFIGYLKPSSKENFRSI